MQSETIEGQVSLKQLQTLHQPHVAALHVIAVFYQRGSQDTLVRKKCQSSLCLLVVVDFLHSILLHALSSTDFHDPVEASAWVGSGLIFGLQSFSTMNKTKCSFVFFFYCCCCDPSIQPVTVPISVPEINPYDLNTTTK